MYVDVVDVGSSHFSVVECVLHREDSAEAFGVSSGEVVSVGRHATAGHFGVDFSAASQSVFEFFKDENHGAFAHHEAVARFAEGARGGFGRVVAGREGVHRVEATHTGGENSGFSAAGYHCVGFAEADKVEGVDDSVVGRSASGNDAIVGAVEAVVHGDVSGGDVGNHLRDEEGVVFWAFFFVFGIITGFFFKGVKAADTGSDDNTDAVFVDSLRVEVGIFDCLSGGY